jgi:hypothetical protein
MVTAKREEAWQMTANVLAAIYNASGNFKKAFNPNQFNPYYKNEQSNIPREDIPLGGSRDLAAFLLR